MSLLYDSRKYQPKLNFRFELRFIKVHNLTLMLSLNSLSSQLWSERWRRFPIIRNINDEPFVITSADTDLKRRHGLQGNVIRISVIDDVDPIEKRHV